MGFGFKLSNIPVISSGVVEPLSKTFMAMTDPYSWTHPSEWTKTSPGDLHYYQVKQEADNIANQSIQNARNAEEARQLAIIAAKERWQKALIDRQALARKAIETDFTGYGANPSNYASDIDAEITRLAGMVPEGTTDFTPFFPSTAGKNLISTLEGKARTNYAGDVNKRFSDERINTDLPDTLYKPKVGETIDRMYNDATQQLSATRSRGLLSDKGYQSALGNIASQRDTQSKNLMDVGSGVLSQQRGLLGDVRTKATNDLSTYKLGGTYDPSSYESSYSTALDSGRKEVGNTLDSLTKGLTFDTRSAINTGGGSQGFVNASGNASQTPSYADEFRRRATTSGSRGLGSQGAF